MQCFGSGVQCLGPVIYQALCTSMLGKELSTGVVNMGLGEPGPRPSYVPAEVLPVPEGYVPSTIDESAQQQKWGSRIGGEHHGAELWHLYSTLAAPLASCCLLRRRRERLVMQQVWMRLHFVHLTLAVEVDTPHLSARPGMMVIVVAVLGLLIVARCARPLLLVKLG